MFGWQAASRPKSGMKLNLAATQQAATTPTYLVHSYLHRHRLASLLGRGGVVVFAESHDVDPLHGNIVLDQVSQLLSCRSALVAAGRILRSTHTEPSPEWPAQLLKTPTATHIHRRRGGNQQAPQIEASSKSLGSPGLVGHCAHTPARLLRQKPWACVT